MTQFSAKNDNHSVWVGVRLSSDLFSWETVQGDTVDAHNGDWTEGQPDTAFGSKQCAVAKKSLGYKWEAVNCLEDKVEFICSLRAPSCPAFYTWIPETGENCFKTSIAGAYEPPTDVTQASAGITWVCCPDYGI